MKKVYYFLFAAMGLASCSNEDALVPENNVSTGVTTSQLSIETRSYDEALAIAKNAISMLEDGDAATRSGEASRTIDLANGVKTYRQNVTRADGSVSNDPLLYVFNFNDNKGFAVVSAKRSTGGLLALVEKGSYDPNSKWNDGSSAIECLENLKEYVAEAKPEATTSVTRGSTVNFDNFYKIAVGQGPDFTVYEELENIHSIKPKLKVSWGQRGNIALCCPNKIAGSGPIALAQIMSFHKWPRHINLTYLDNRDNYQNWEKMLESKTPAQVPADFFQFPAFIREIGQRTGTTYMSNKSVTDINKLRDFMISQQYAVSFMFSINPEKDYRTNAIYSILTDMSFVVAQRTSAKGNTHTFVIDGCNYYRYRVYQQFKNGNINVYYEDPTNLNHINWCEGGNYDGYYSTYSLSPYYYTTDEGAEYFEGEKKPEYSGTMKFFSTGR